MKNSIKPYFLLLFIEILSTAYTVQAQNQSMLLPIPGDVDPNPTGSRCINFTNPANPSISQLPAHPFLIDPFTYGDPHIEAHLSIAGSLMNELYLGQHPMYAQQVVHDKEGNLLFFIVDNNIYNRYGEANKLRMKNKLM